SIRLRSKGGFFNEPYFRGIAQHAGELERLVQSDTDPPGWLDTQALVHCVRQSALGIGNDRIQMDRPNVTLARLKWPAFRFGAGAGAAEVMEESERLAAVG